MRDHPLFNFSLPFSKYFPFVYACPFLREGAVFKMDEYGADVNQFWVIEGAKRRRTNLRAYVARGWRFEDARYCPRKIAEEIPEGPPLADPGI